MLLALGLYQGDHEKLSADQAAQERHKTSHQVGSLSTDCWATGRRSRGRHDGRQPQTCLLCFQVGNLSTESRYWGYPEAFTGARPSYYVPTSIGTSDLTGSMAAAFAASSLAFQETDKAYAQVTARRPANQHMLFASEPPKHRDLDVQLLAAGVCTRHSERLSRCLKLPDTMQLMPPSSHRPHPDRDPLLLDFS